jgi:hypothetical protein
MGGYLGALTLGAKYIFALVIVVCEVNPYLTIRLSKGTKMPTLKNFRRKYG